MIRLATGLVLSVACLQASSLAFAADAGMIASAASAAPPAIGKAAMVMTMDGKVLRQGTNGWTCFPDDPKTPGKDPMCVDKNGMAWAMAWMGHKPPPRMVGLAYMLQGGADASNLDPYAAKPASGGKWVMTGPHMMVLSADVAASSGYPSKEPAPDTSRPYVMFAGTPYAHVMFPMK